MEQDCLLENKRNVHALAVLCVALGAMLIRDAEHDAFKTSGVTPEVFNERRAEFGLSHEWTLLYVYHE